MGLTEMLPDKVWSVLGQSVRFGYWFLRRSGWVLGSSLAIVALPPFLEHQRQEVEEMQNMQKKQVRTCAWKVKSLKEKSLKEWLTQQ